MHFYVYSLIYKYLPCDLQPQSCVSSTREFLFYCVRIYIPQNLYNPDQNSSLPSQRIYDHMFSDTYLEYILYDIWLFTWLIYFPLSYVMIYHLIRIWEGVGLHYALNPKWIE